MLQEALRQEQSLVASLRSERLMLLANVDNMNSMFDVARKLTRLATIFVTRFVRLFSADALYIDSV
jgi:hypothetical protein